MEIEIKATSQLTPWEQEHILNWLLEEFDPDADGTVWSDVDWHVLVWLDGQLVSHAEIVERTGTVGGQPVKLGGVGGVVTRPAWRGRGLSSAALERAASFMRDELGVEFGLLICDEKLVPFYRRLGWQVVAGPLIFAQPGGAVSLSGAVMVLPCRGQTWPPGLIDLCGPPW